MKQKRHVNISVALIHICVLLIAEKTTFHYFVWHAVARHFDLCSSALCILYIFHVRIDLCHGLSVFGWRLGVVNRVSYFLSDSQFYCHCQLAASVWSYVLWQKTPHRPRMCTKVKQKLYTFYAVME